MSAQLRLVKPRHENRSVPVRLPNDEASGPSANVATAPSAPGVSSEDRAERRQVTVMFSDLVGSTVLSVHMDPASPLRIWRHFVTAIRHRASAGAPRDQDLVSLPPSCPAIHLPNNLSVMGGLYGVAL
jgi:class 3 adenylate cyclase